MSPPVSIWRWLAPMFAVTVTLIVASLLIIALGKNPLVAFAALVDGALAGPGLGNLQATINRSAMIVGAALAAGLALRSGFLNIGIEGQMVVGGVTAAITAQWLAGVPVLGLPAVLLCAALAGGLWALCAGLMQLRLGIPLLISSLILNYPAIYLASWLVGHPFRDVTSGMAASPRVPAELRLSPVAGTEIYLSAPIVLVLAVVMALFFRRMTLGYAARMAGMSPRFARASGISVDRLGAYVVFASGAIAGLLGALAVLGEHHRYIDGMLVRPLYAWTGLMAVLLGGTGIPGLVAAGGFFAALSTGAMGMERAADVPRAISRVLLACIILLVAARGSARLGGDKG